MGFEVDPDHLREHGGAIEAIGTDRAGALSQSHDQTVSGGPASWGSDAAGTAAGGVYQELASLTGEVLGLVTECLADNGARVRKMAEMYERADQSFADKLRGLHDGFEPQP